MEKRCSICGAPVSEDAAILTLSAYGTPRLICDSCEKKLDATMNGKTYAEIAEATESLAEIIENRGCEDEVVLEKMHQLFTEAKERAELIKAGKYDFSKEDSENTNEDIPEEYLESEEDRLLDEKEAAANKKFDNVMSIVCGVVFVAALVFFIIKFIL